LRHVAKFAAPQASNVTQGVCTDKFAMSALILKADIIRHDGNVRGPIGDIEQIVRGEPGPLVPHSRRSPLKE